MIHIYTGEGKGKTTAALGLALRAAGAGKKVFIGQFCKGRHYSELAALEKLKNIRIEQFGRSCFIRKDPTAEDCRRARAGLARIREVIKSKAFSVIILDEINIALQYCLIPVSEVVELVGRAPKSTELVLTGRNAPPRLIACADLVSEIRELKHYYARGVKARRGIEY